MKNEKWIEDILSDNLSLCFQEEVPECKGGVR